MSLALISARERGRRPGRRLLTMLGVAIGVAGVVSIGTAIETTRDAYRTVFETLGGRTDLEVVSGGEGGVAEDLASSLERIDGVAAAVPIVQRPAAVRLGGKNPVPVLALGIDPARDAAVRSAAVTAGRPLRPGDEGVVLDEALARRYGVAPQDRIPVLSLHGFRELEVLGLRPTGETSMGGTMLLPLRIAQELFDLPGRATAIQLVAAPGFDVDELRGRIASEVGDDLLVDAPAQRGSLSRASLASMEQALQSLSGVSLVAGAFVIMNAFLMTLGERRRQVSLLRSLGATRRQVVRMLLAEAARIGALGTILGIALGLGVAWGLTRVLEEVLTVTLPALAVSPRWIAAGVVMGPTVALAASWWPARRAGRVEPIEGLVERRARAAERPDRRGVCLGFVLIALPISLVPLLLKTDLIPPAIAPPAMAVFLVGCVLALPVVLGPVSRLAGRVLPTLLGPEGRLAVLQLGRRPARTAYTAGVLFIAVVVGIGSGNSLLNATKDVADWCRRALPDDFYIRATFPDPALLTAATLPEEAAEEIRGWDGVERLYSINFVPTRVEGTSAILLARDFFPGRAPDLDLEGGDPLSVAAALIRGEVVIGTRLARLLKRGPGDRLSLTTQEGPRDFVVAGLCTEYSAGGAAIYLHRPVARRLFGFEGTHAFVLAVRPDARARLNDRIREWCEARGLWLQTRAELFGVIDGMMSGVIGFIWVLITLMYVVAALGVVNTLTMNVLEQRRELALLRAVALTRRRTFRLVLAQALAIALMAVIPGVVVGIFFSWAQTVSSYPLIGHPVEFDLDFLLVLGTALGAGVVALVSAQIPARRAARTPILETLHYE